MNERHAAYVAELKAIADSVDDLAPILPPLYRALTLALVGRLLAIIGYLLEEKEP